jgi:hypothetical protein
MNLANVKNVRKVNTGGNTRHEARIQTYRVDHGCGYCMRVGLMYLRRKESYTNSFSNGNSGPEIVELNAKIREHGTGHMDGRRRLLITSGLIRVVTVTTVHTHTQNVRLSEQTSAAHGCGASFRYITGRKASASSLVLEKGWPSNDQYTFFHVTRRTIKKTVFGPM